MQIEFGILEEGLIFDESQSPRLCVYIYIVYHHEFSPPLESYLRLDTVCSSSSGRYRYLIGKALEEEDGP